MGIIYVIYTLLSCAAMFVYCRKFAQPRWWPAAVFIFPLSLPVFVYRTGKGKVLPLAAVSVVLFFAAITGEWALMQQKKAKNPGETIPPIIKKIVDINQDVRLSTIQIYETSKKLDSLSMVLSRATDIKSSMKTISTLRERVQENNRKIDHLIEFITEHEAYLYRQQIPWVLAIRLFYSDPIIQQHHQSRSNYLKTFETLLAYTHDNYENIVDKKSPVHLKNYEAYYMLYRRAADSHNQFNRKRIMFQKEFIEAYPEVKSFLPGAHHMEPFKFWDKFSF